MVAGISRAGVAVLCGLALLAGGCGSSGGGSAAEVKTRCAEATAARASEHEVLGELGIDVGNAPLLRRARSSVEAFRAASQQLASALSGSKRSEISALAAALSQQEKEMTAFLQHDAAGEQTYGVGLNPKLYAGFKSLATICAKA